MYQPPAAANPTYAQPVVVQQQTYYNPQPGYSAAPPPAPGPMYQNSNPYQQPNPYVNAGAGGYPQQTYGGASAGYQQPQPQAHPPPQQQQEGVPSRLGRWLGGIGAMAVAGVAAGASAALRPSRPARPPPNPNRPLTNHVDDMCACDPCEECCDCLTWVVRAIASFFAAILLLPFQIPIVLIGWIFSGLVWAIPLTCTWYAAIWNTGVLGPCLKCAMFVVIIPVLVIGWALSLAASPFVVWFVQTVAIATGDQGFLNVGVQAVEEYWKYLSVVLPGDLREYGRERRDPPFDLNPFVFIFVVLFSLVASFAFVLPVTAVTAVLAFIPSIVKFVQISVAGSKDPLLAICSLLFVPFGAVGMLVAGIIWPCFNSLIGVWEAWLNSSMEFGIRYPVKAIENYFLMLKDFFNSTSATFCF